MNEEEKPMYCKKCKEEKEKPYYMIDKQEEFYLCKQCMKEEFPSFFDDNPNL